MPTRLVKMKAYFTSYSTTSLCRRRQQLEGLFDMYMAKSGLDKFGPELLKTRIARIACGSHTEVFPKSDHIYKISLTPSCLICAATCFRVLVKTQGAHARPKGRHLNLHVLFLKVNFRKSLSCLWIGIVDPLWWYPSLSAPV